MKRPGRDESFCKTRTMKKIKIAALLGAFSIGAVLLYAQEAPQVDPMPPHHPRGHHPPPPPPPGPLLIALDANKDGVLDATEIANASAALLQLDKNKDGQLTFEELRPPCPFPGGPPPDDFDGNEPPPFRNQ